jgi:hypothetical protein
VPEGVDLHCLAGLIKVNSYFIFITAVVCILMVPSWLDGCACIMFLSRNF